MGGNVKCALHTTRVPAVQKQTPRDRTCDLHRLALQADVLDGGLIAVCFEFKRTYARASSSFTATVGDSNIEWFRRLARKRIMTRQIYIAV